MKSDLLQRLKEIADSDDVLQHRGEFNRLKSQFNDLLDHGITEVKDGESQEEEEEEEFRKPSSEEEKSSQNESPSEEESFAAAEKEEIESIREEFKAYVAKFKEKVKRAHEDKKKLEKQTVEEARKLLAELKELVAEEENIGKAFARFNEIREHWKELPKVSNDDYRDLNSEYNKYVEQFFYNINIYKELKELDLKHNLDQKRAVLENQKKLLDENDIRLLEVEVRLNQDRWNEIGPTFKEEWDKIKGEFWETTRAIYSKIQEFYEGRKEEQAKNLEEKKKLVEHARHIVSLDLKSAKKWQDKSNDLVKIQKEWKMIGFVPKEQSAEIWKEFKTLCDTFFDKKRKYFEELRKEQNANKEAKLKLLNEAMELKDSEDWQETSRTLIRLQKEWKEVGAAHQRDENRMWRQFREACDHFFQRRKEFRAGKEEREAENLKQKENLLAELEKWEPKKDSNPLKELKEFSKKWRNIGFVPIGKKDEINAKYKELLDSKYEAMDIDKAERKKLKLEEKIESLKDSSKGDYILRKEQDHIRNRINKLENDIIQFENNMGFLAQSKGAEQLKEEVQRKIEKARQEIEALQEQAQMLKNA